MSRLRVRLGILALGVALLFSLLCHRQATGLLYPIELLALDRFFVLRGPVPVDPRIVLVEIDRRSIESFARPQLFWQDDLSRAMLDGGGLAVGWTSWWTTRWSVSACRAPTTPRSRSCWKPRRASCC